VEARPPTLTDGTNVYVVENLSNAYSALIKTGDYSVLTYFIDSVKSGKIAYLFVISTIVGIAMCYVIFSFAIDLGIRVAKLIFLQIIAPVPVIFRAMPKGKDVFNNWVKMLAQTYANLFIRVGAMYIGVEVIVILTSSNVSLFVNSGETNLIIMLANALIVMGVVAFAKESPKMLAKLFPFLDGQLKLGIKDKLAEGGAFALGAGAGAMVTGAVQNFAGTKGNLWHKFGNGLLGAAAGAKNGVMAGAKAKSWSDMKNATTTAGAKVAASRAARAQRNARYKESGYFATKFGDFKDAASVWATGGLNKFAAEETFIGDVGKNISAIENGIDKLYDRQSTNGKVQTAYLKQSADKALEEYSKGFTLNKAYKDAYGNEHTFETQEEYEKFRNVLEYQKKQASGLSKEAMAAKIAAAQKAGYQKDATVTDMYGQETTIRDENAYYSYISDLTKQMGDIDRGSKKMLKNLSSSGNTKALETMGAYSVTGDKLIVDQAQADFQIAKDYIGEHSGMAQQLNDGQAVDIKNFDYDSLSNFKDQLSRKSNEIAVEKAKLQREQQMRDSSKPKDK
jgi:ferritin-like metal-binding protein YciE